MWSIYNVMNNEFLELKLSLSYKRRFSGSSEGWLVFVNEDHTVTLHRPEFIAKEKNNLVGASINLQCLFPPEEVEDPENWDPDELQAILDEERPDYHVVKALITADPLANPDNCTIVVTFGGQAEIAFIRYNKDPTLNKIENVINFDDILHYKNNIYALGYQGLLISFDSAEPYIVKQITPKMEAERLIRTIFCIIRTIFMPCDILQVERLNSKRDDLIRSTRMFRVYKMDFDEKRWVEIKNLGGAALFVGDNTSISVLASDFNGCKPNCINFTHDKHSFPSSNASDLGIYHVESGSFELHYTIDPSTFLS